MSTIVDRFGEFLNKFKKIMPTLVGKCSICTVNRKQYIHANRKHYTKTEIHGIYIPKGVQHVKRRAAGSTNAETDKRTC